MKWEANIHNLGDQTLDMVVTGVQCLLRILMVFIVAITEWRTLKALIVAVNMVTFNHQAMAAITYLVAAMLAEALTHLHCILIVACAVVVIWVVEALDPTIELVYRV